ncbi:hypothetical protein BD31_I1071 [Candidatus Nitrosopumilus salaria BD31]|uniref:Uncharacterized protein n=1 Tax=Candidatus Nitrosopumilus salarius BD31 TaxID=859350 RepID=I3D057_9ARCH|nr:hypothetical protein BD31_I1071 [Candidatus Nitrosopumilus salaria BD31]
MTEKKSMAEILQEEKEKFLAEINQKIKKKKVYFKSEPETGFDNFSNK